MFDSREAYLEFRRNWRGAYRDLTIEVRDLKHAMKNKARSGEIVSAEMKRLNRLRLSAFHMCERLDDAKAEARARAGTRDAA